MKCIIRRSVLKQTGMTVAALALPTRKTLGFERQSSTRGEAPDYTSDVPKFTFADTLEEQEAQLKTNPIILRFVESRKHQSANKWCPRYHFTCPDLPHAIYPNPEERCYSGSALAEKDRVIACYHGFEIGNMIAISTDPLLLNWEKLTGKAVIPKKNTPIGEEEPFKLRVFVDRSIVEVFVNGKQCVAVPFCRAARTASVYRCAARARTPCSHGSTPGR